MEMDCNLKQLANFFKFLVYILEKSLKTDFSFFLPLGNHFIFSYWFSKSDFMLKKGFFVKYLSSFGQDTAKSP